MSSKEDLLGFTGPDQMKELAGFNPQWKVHIGSILNVKSTEIKTAEISGFVFFIYTQFFRMVYNVLPPIPKGQA